MNIPVVIVGGGPVGLALAADLGWRGVECLLVEQGDGEIFHPRANTVNSRSMEFCRRWGIAGKVKNAGAPPDFPLDILYVTSLQGHTVARINRPTYGGTKPLPTTPERSQRCNQIFFDPILRDLAQSISGVTLRHQCQFEKFRETDDGVAVTVRDLTNNLTETIFAQYLVACCGGQSTIPGTLGIEWEGTPILSNHLNVFLRIPELWNHHDKGKAAFYFFVDADGGNQSLIELDGNTLWRLGLELRGEQTTIDVVDVDALVRKWIGPEVPYEKVSVLPWTCRSLVADCWQSGRVFLAGDAVHQHSPQGGFGMNTGLGDAVDLAWKLAATLQGWGGANLLASYQLERQPVARRIVRQATDTMGELADRQTLAMADTATADGEAARRKLNDRIIRNRTEVFLSDGIVLGVRYDSSPIVCHDGTPPLKESVSIYTPTSRPGARAPHGWLSKNRSMLDLFGKCFVLLAFNKSGSEGLKLVNAAHDLNMPIDLIEVDDADISALYERRLVLVRPDGHIAWRGDIAPDDPMAIIDKVRGA